MDSATIPPCALGDIIMRYSNFKMMLVKYLVLSDCIRTTKLRVRGGIGWPKEEDAYQYDVLVLWVDPSLPANEREWTDKKLRVFFHRDEISVIQALTEDVNAE